MQKEEKKGKQMRDKLKERLNKKGHGRQDAIIDEKIQRIGSYNIYIGVVIGEGSYGKVFKAKNDANQTLACKIIFKSQLEKFKTYGEQQYAQQMQKRFKTESEFHKQLSGCANVVKLVETIENNKAYYFFMEYCQSDLSKIIRQNGILSEEVAIKYFSEMLEGYKSIYERNAFHRDLKPQNLLIKDDVVKISDFGFVKIFNQFDQQCKSGKNKLRTESKVGSMKYMAPDVLYLAMSDSLIQSKTYNAQKCDMWSMGIILYKMLYGKQPFNGKDQQQMIKKINQKQIQFPDTVELSPEVIRNAKVSPQIKRLLKKMIQKDEASRITFKKLYHTIKSFIEKKEIQKMGSGIKQENQGKQNKEGEAKNKKEQLLIFYNKIIVQLYRDSVNYATFRQIGIEKYLQVAFKLMTLIHQKRTVYLQTDEKDDNPQYVSQKIKQDISQYHNSFWGPIKNQAKFSNDEAIESLLLSIYQKIRDYPQFDLLMKQVQIFLIDILLLLSLQLKIVKSDYVYTWSMRASNYKQNVILNYKQNTLTMLQRKLNHKQTDALAEQEQLKDKKRKDKTRDKDKKHKSKGKQKQKQYKQVEPKKQKDKQKQKRQRSQQKPKDRSSRQKKSKK